MSKSGRPNIDNLAELRKARGYKSQHAFAEAIGIPFRTYQDIEAGRWPQRSNLNAIAAGLGMTVGELIEAPGLASEKPMDRPTDEELLALLGERLARAKAPEKLPESLSAVQRDLLDILAPINDPQMAAKAVNAFRKLVGSLSRTGSGRDVRKSKQSAS